MSRFEDATLIDSVFGYCARNNVEVNSLSDLTFLEVSKRLAFDAENHPRWIQASREIRRGYAICHSACHIKRIQHLMRSHDTDAPANVVEFPTTTTRH